MRRSFFPNTRRESDSARSRWTRWPLSAAAVVVCSTIAVADYRSIDFDPSVDFAAVKTFAIRPGVIRSQKPELNNRLFLLALDDAIRTTLSRKGLKETQDRPDVTIDVSVAGMDYSITGGQRGVRIPGGPRGRGTVIPGTGPQPELFTEGTLVIDMTQPASAKLIWRGTYRDEERSGPTLARKLPEDVKKLLSEFPPKRNRD